MRAVVGLWGLSFLAACGGEDRAAWLATLNAGGTDLQVIWLQDELSQDAGARSATIVREVQCPDGGRATRCDNGTVEFEDCVFGEGESMDGRLVLTEGNPQVFTFEEMTGQTRGEPWSASGGYTTTTTGGVTTTVIDLTHTGVDDGRPFTATATGSMTFVDSNADTSTVSGSLAYTMTFEGGEPITTGCVFPELELKIPDVGTDGFDYEAWAADIDEALRKACDYDVKAVVRRMHRHSSDGDPIHITVQGEPMGEDNRVQPGGTRTERIEDPIIGTTVYLAVGRQDQIYASTVCFVEDKNEVIEAVYTDGFGLNAFEFYCTTKADRRAAE